MFQITTFSSFAIFLLPVVLGQATTACAGCNSLRAQWDPNANTGACLGSMSDPISYIVSFEKCICSSESQSDYASCFNCSNTASDGSGDDSIPIDGLNFGPADQFSSACVLFASHVTSILEPSGLSAFANVVTPIETMSIDVPGTADILGYLIYANVAVETASGILVDSTVSNTQPTPKGVATDNGSSTPTSSGSQGSFVAVATGNSTGSGKSDASKDRGSTIGLFVALAIAISAAIFF
jgi:hypothetical protein